ncbi:MAG: ATP-binding cassette domain-containing protein [Hyphomicrobiales bacterium]|nr:ATP-binding cassette domain-containing protein [Hyphomicrobiales bacterium]MDE2115306.1 ATP-binding cassette domain-containing protein [Hyphomicrobiales bacterium]
MAPPLLTLQGITLTLGGKPLLEGADLSVAPRERLALVGRNGSGKSTLLKIAAGALEPDGGQRFFQPNATVRYLAQEPDLSGFATTLAYVESGLGEHGDHWRAEYLLGELGLTGREDPSHLSGGEARRAAIAYVLAPEPDILLLDEPTNHLDLPIIEWLEKELASLRSAMVLISHDRRFLETLTKSTLWLDRGVTRQLDQGFAAFESWRDTVLEEEELQRHKLDRKIVMEEDWVRYGVSGRRKRNQGRLARLADLRSERREARRVVGEVRLEASTGRTSGKLVVEAENISKSFGDRPIVTDFSIRIQRGDRVGIVGPNGAGKTTLIKMLTGALEPDSGVIQLGAALEMASLDQRRTSLDGHKTLKDVLTGGASDFVEVNGIRKHVIGYMKDFLFTPEQARTPVERLSGGERGRLTLARALSLPSNFLVLDEPTNDLDLETLDLLQEMLADYSGTVIVVSHDRDFLDRVATSVIVAEGNGRWIEYAGGYADMVAQRGFGVGATSAQKPAERPRPSEGVASAPKPKASQKLSFKQKHALEHLPGQIETLRATMAKWQKVLDDPKLYHSDPKKFDQATREYSRAEQALQRAEEEWLSLEMLREAAEA